MGVINMIRNESVSRVERFWTQLTLAEISGALGDLGTFLPLVIGLVKTTGLDLGTTLLFTGFYNIITGIMFDIPMPVQPMKTIAAVALSDSGGLTIPQIMAAGIFTSSCVLFLGCSGLMSLAIRIIPSPVIRGMQLGLGLNLAVKGFQQVWYKDGVSPDSRPWFEMDGRFLGLAAILFTFLTVFPRDIINSESGSVNRSQKMEQMNSTSVADIQDLESEDQVSSNTCNSSSFVTQDSTAKKVVERINRCNLEISEQSVIIPENVSGIRSFLLIRKISSVLETLLKPVYLIGDAAGRACGVHLDQKSMTSLERAAPGIPAALVLVVLGLVLVLATNGDLVKKLSFGPSTPEVVVPTSAEWRTGILRAGLPQLSLTVFNSVISVSQLALQLFPDRPAAPGDIATSVGLMNLFGCWFGAMPSCHGAGGLAAQFRFGARYGAAPIFLGILKVLLSIMFGSSLFMILKDFPSALLGAMLIIAGLELAAVSRGQHSSRSMAVMLFTAAVTLALKHAAEGAVAGLIIAYALALRDFAVDTFVRIWRQYRNGRECEKESDEISMA